MNPKYGGLTDNEFEMLRKQNCSDVRMVCFIRVLDSIFSTCLCCTARHLGTPQQQNIQAAAAAAAAQQQQQGGAGDTTLPSKPTINRQGDSALL